MSFEFIYQNQIECKLVIILKIRKLKNQSKNSYAFQKEKYIETKTSKSINSYNVIAKNPSK